MVAPRSTANQEAGSLKRILYVEDNAINSKVIEFGLRGHYHVTVAVDAREACEALHDHSGAFAAILMDIELQGSDLDGIQLTRLFRGKLDSNGLPEYAVGIQAVDTPIIIVTAYLERYSDEYLRLAGASTSLNKPVNLTGLRDMLEAMHR